jgi:hypothetical protein
MPPSLYVFISLWHVASCLSIIMICSLEIVMKNPHLLQVHSNEA